MVVVIDTNPVAWQSLSNILPVNQALADILVFVNAHLALNNENQAAVIASHTNSAKFLYPRPTEQKPGSSITTDRRDPLREANAYRPFRVVEDLVIENFKLLLKNTSISGISHKSSSMMSGAIALALGYINRAIIDVGEEAKMKARILVVSASGDLAFQYIPMMNCIFSAQKKRVPIDICKIGGDAIFLQQASDATKGLYVNVEHPKGLLQYLLVHTDMSLIHSLRLRCCSSPIRKYASISRNLLKQTWTFAPHAFVTRRF